MMARKYCLSESYTKNGKILKGEKEWRLSQCFMGLLYLCIFSITDSISCRTFTFVIKSMNLSNKARLVQAWIEIHKEDLIADWELASSGQEVFKIEPLR
jgi:hypothetical protein